MIKRWLERKPAAGGDDPHVTCWFNAWMTDATDLAAAFAAELARMPTVCGRSGGDSSSPCRTPSVPRRAPAPAR